MYLMAILPVTHFLSLAKLQSKNMMVIQYNLHHRYHHQEQEANMQTYGRNPQTATAFSDKIEKVAKRVVLQTLSDVILGDFYYRPRLRLIDELISGDQYLAITNAIVYDKSGRVRFRANFLSVNRDHIVLIIPWDEMVTKKDTLSLLHRRA
jgi:Family of unknown function (DUF6812)